MDRPAKLLIGAVLGLLGVSAFAGYAQLADPPGFSGGPGDWKFAPSANDSHFGKVVHQPNGLKFPVGGRPVTMPAGYRFAANAPRIAAAILFNNPYVRAAVGIAGWLLAGKVIWDEVEKVWREVSDDNLDKNEYKVTHGNITKWASNRELACGDYVTYLNTNRPNQFTSFAYDSVVGDTCYVNQFDSRYPNEKIKTAGGIQKRTSPGECPEGWKSSPAGCLSPALDQPTFVEKLNDPNISKPMPDTVPWELPYPSPLPVEEPWINPAPGPNPEHRPRFVPTGDPTKNPNYDPNAEPSPENQPWIQPGVRIKPSPTPDKPWQVDVQPIDRPQPNPDPLGEEDEGTGQGKPGDKPQEQSDLCAKNPDIVACAKMDEVSPDKVNNEDKTLVITPEQGWGNENASCPAPVTKQVAGLSLEMSWQPFCDFATGIRPVVIAMAWLSAVLLVLGIARKES